MSPIGGDWIENRILQLGERALENGITLVYRFEKPSRSGISILLNPAVPVAAVHAALNANRIYASIRSGAIRVAPHYYSEDEDMDRIVAVMASAAQTASPSWQVRPIGSLGPGRASITVAISCDV